MRFIKEVVIFLCGFFICAIVLKVLSPEQTSSFIIRFVKAVGLLFIGVSLGGTIMACLSVGKIDDIQSGRIDG